MANEKEKVKKPFYKRWWVWLIVIILFIGIIGGGDDDDVADGEVEADEQVEEATQNEEVEETPETEESEEPVNDESDSEEGSESTFSVGDAAKVGDVVFSVNSVDETAEIDSGNEFVDNATTSGKFVILNVTVKNEDNDAITTDSSFFKLKSGDNTYDPSTDFEIMMAMDEDDFFLTSINPGLDKTGYIVFEVPEDVEVSSSVLQAQTGFFGTETIEISLE